MYKYKRKEVTNEFLYALNGKKDECYTYRYGVEPLLEFLPPYNNKIIWCPFDTEESEFVKVFKDIRNDGRVLLAYERRGLEKGIAYEI